MTSLDTILQALRSKVESENEGWGEVYLDNAMPDDITPRQWAGYLSALERAGMYRPIDNYAWGSVKL
jgi:hypothetical protein